jgi:hypothetical protein
MPTQTLHEAFQKWQAVHHQLGHYPTQYEAAEAGFLAGAKAEREDEDRRLRPLLDALRASLHSDAHDLEADYMRLREELASAYRQYKEERRIKERDNANTTRI